MAARATQTALIAIVSLAIGMLLGSLFSGGGLAKDVAAATPGFTAQVLDAQPSARPPQSPGLASAQAFEPRVSIASNAAAKERPEAPAVENERPHTEASTVLGSIATLEGTPIAGVELELEPPKDAPKYRVRRATSDASGKFEFSGLPQGVWRITGRHREYALQRKNTFPQLVPTGSEVAFIACPAIQIDVRVAGEGADRARVAFRRANHGEPEWSSWTSANTVLALSPGVWELCASVDALEDWPSDRDWKIAPLASPVTTVHAGGADAQIVTLALESVR